MVRDNDVHDNDLMMVNTPDVRGDDVGGEAISLVKSTGHVLVTNNRIWGNRAQSYDYGYDGGAFSVYAASNWTITGNTTWDNRNIMETGTDANKTPCDNNVFTRNLNYGATTVHLAAPGTAIYSTTPSNTSTIDTSKVPPPRSNTRKGSCSRVWMPKASAAAVGSLISRSTLSPASSPARRVALRWRALK